MSTIIYSHLSEAEFQKLDKLLKPVQILSQQLVKQQCKEDISLKVMKTARVYNDDVTLDTLLSMIKDKVEQVGKGGFYSLRCLPHPKYNPVPFIERKGI